jgi:outer membrane immunogenic protein
MKKLLVASVATFALAAAARGADLPAAYQAPPTALSSWQGFYLGIDGGMTRHDGSFDDLSGFVFVNNGQPNSFSTAKTGGIAGGYAGYNWQHRSFVYGAEADISWVGTKATEFWGTSGVNPFQQSQDINWLATFRARAGIDVESTLFYLTGGLAVAKVNDSFNGFCPPLAACGGVPGGAMYAGFSDSKAQLGWTAGLGFEHLFDAHWTLRGEFRYVDLGRTSVTCVAVAAPSCTLPPALRVPATFQGEFSDTLISGLVGLGYKF